MLLSRYLFEWMLLRCFCLLIEIFGWMLPRCFFTHENTLLECYLDAFCLCFKCLKFFHEKKRIKNLNIYTTKMERFVIIVNGWSPLTNITKCSILDFTWSLLQDLMNLVFFPEGNSKWLKPEWNKIGPKNC